MTLQVGGRDGAADWAGPAREPFRLSRAVADLYDELPLDRVLDRMLAHTARIVGTSTAAVSVVDAASGRYTKAAERGVSCQVGRSFPLDEGATGRAYGRRSPVVVADYATLAAGHLPADDQQRHRSVAAVPLWWRDQVIAVTVAFRPHGDPFTAETVDALECLTQAAASAVLAAGRADRSPLGRLLDRSRASGDAPHPLTDRESEVLALVRRGCSDRQAAAARGISVKTVEKHVGALLRKTGAPNRTAAVVIATERGWGTAG